MKRIGVLFDGNLCDRKGMVNATLSRIVYLKTISQYPIDIYAIQYTNNILNIFKQRTSEIAIDGLCINVIKCYSFFADSILRRLKINYSFTDSFIISKLSKYLQNCILLSVHSLTPGYVAYMMKRKYGIPYYVTWHGSDIHTIPYSSSFYFSKVKRTIEASNRNFYVSKALYAQSLNITRKQEYDVLYNGVSQSFSSFSTEQKKGLRINNEVLGKHVIAFAGNLIPIKNVSVLPDIFKSVRNQIADVIFWIIGDGNQRYILEKKCSEYDLTVKFWGNLPHSKMPEIFNCIDVLVLPSKNEGLPLVLAEAILCGSNAVGSKVGGISEVIGEENSFNLDSNFVANISNRICYFINTGCKQEVPPVFDWENTSKKEYNHYLKTLSE